MSTATATTFKTECRLCHVVDQNPPLNIKGDEKQQPKAVTQFIEKLLKHIGKKHTKELMQGRGLLEQYQVCLILSQFDSEDPSVQAVLEGMRADIFQRCRKNVPTDAHLDIVVGKCELGTRAEHENVFAAMKALRDLCCETGPHAPNLP